MKTSNKEFEIFVNECEYFVELFGITDWKIYYSHEMWSTDSYANCDLNKKARVATINLSTEWNDDIKTKKEMHDILKEIALHEVCHILLSDMCHLAMSKKINSMEDIDSIEHIIIRRLEKAFIKKE